RYSAGGVFSAVRPVLVTESSYQLIRPKTRQTAAAAAQVRDAARALLLIPASASAANGMRAAIKSAWKRGGTRNWVATSHTRSDGVGTDVCGIGFGSEKRRAAATTPANPIPTNLCSCPRRFRAARAQSSQPPASRIVAQPT